MILERVPGKNLQEKRFQKLTQVSLTPGEEDVERRRRRKNGKKETTKLPPGPNTDWCCAEAGGTDQGGKIDEFFSFFFLYHFPTTTTTTLCNRFLRTFRIHDVLPVKNRHTRTNQPTGGHDATALFFPENDDDGFYGTRRRTGFRIRSRTKEK